MGLSRTFNGKRYFFRNIAPNKKKLNDLLTFYRSTGWLARYVEGTYQGGQNKGKKCYRIYTRRK